MLGRAPRVTSATACATCRMCSGVVPQQPPTNSRPNPPTKPLRASASSSGVGGYSSTVGAQHGQPAFGITDTGTGMLDRYRRCSLISAGPVAQFRPSCRCRVVRSRSAPPRSPNRAAWCRWFRRSHGEMIGMDRPSSAIAMTGRDHRGLHLQQVLAGLDEDRVGAAVEHAGHAFRRRCG